MCISGVVVVVHGMGWSCPASYGAVLWGRGFMSRDMDRQVGAQRSMCTCMHLRVRVY